MEELRLSEERAPSDTVRHNDLSLTGARLTEKIAASFAAFTEHEHRLLSTGISTREGEARFVIRAVTASGVIGLVYASGALYVILRGLRRRRAIEADLRESLAEKQILLKEVHHRVKNNLQVVSGLLSLESEKLKDPAAAVVFRECRDRIHSMARLHQQLYARGRFAHVEFAAHLKETAETLVRAHAPTGCKITLQMEADLLEADLDVAVNLGLIVNELILNSLKHAFPGRASGALTVELHTGNPCELSVRDDGQGFSAGFDPSAGAGLGLELVLGLASQIRGEAILRNNPTGGAAATIRFPRSDSEGANRS
jgi:two-component sensor histidine kinase